MEDVCKRLTRLYNDDLRHKKLDPEGYIEYLEKFDKTYCGNISLMKRFALGLNQGKCFDMSACALLCFDDTAFLMRGFLYNKDFLHGWIEFTNSKGEQIVYDTTFIGFFHKKDYYEVFGVIETSRRTHLQMKEYEMYWEIKKKSEQQPPDEFMLNLMYAMLKPEEKQYLARCEQIIREEHPEFLDKVQGYCEILQSKFT